MATIDNKIGLKLKGEQKFKKVIETSFEETIKKPAWVKVKVMSYSENYKAVKDALRSNSLKTVCEEASCPNMGECFHHGTASFMIMGDICTRRCVFCDVAFGKPNILSKDEPKSLAKVIKDMNLQYVVITSVDRDDLADGGAKHFVDCITEIRKTSPNTKIEVLTPDFRGRLDIAINILKTNLADVFNHNMETVERLYKSVRPGANFAHSLSLLKKMKNETGITTKSGIMVGLGETDEEVFEIMQEMRTHDIDMITIGQYLQPSKHHINVQRYVTPEQFLKYQEFGEQIGFINVASGVMVRSSYHADLQFSGKQ